MKINQKYFAYVRVSSNTQNEARQIESIKTYFNNSNIQNYTIKIDKISGTVKASDRALEQIFSNDYTNLIIQDFDRLGRNTIDILQTIERLHAKNINVTVLNYNVSSILENKTKNPLFTMLCSLLSTIAQQEREKIKERQKQGIEIAKRDGKFKGRAKGTTENKKDFLNKYKNVQKAIKQELSIRQISKLCDVSINTVRKVKALM